MRLHVSCVPSDENAAYTTGALVTGLLVLLSPLDPARVPRPGAGRPDDKPPEPALVLSPRSFRFFSMRAPYRTMVSKAMWMYRNSQPQITTGGLNRNRHRHHGRVRTSEANARTRWAIDSMLQRDVKAGHRRWDPLKTLNTAFRQRAGQGQHAVRVVKARGENNESVAAVPRKRVGNVFLSSYGLCSEIPFCSVLVSVHPQRYEARRAASDQNQTFSRAAIYISKVSRLEETPSSRKTRVCMFGPGTTVTSVRRTRRRATVDDFDALMYPGMDSRRPKLP